METLLSELICSGENSTMSISTCFFKTASNGGGTLNEIFSCLPPYFSFGRFGPWGLFSRAALI